MGSSVPGGIQETDITHQIQKIRDISTFELVHVVNQFLTLWAYSYRGPVHEMTPEEGISLPRPARRRISWSGSRYRDAPPAIVPGAQPL